MVNLDLHYLDLSLCVSIVFWFWFVILQDSGGDLDAKIEVLLNTEKQMRLNGDVAGTKKAVTEILQLCFDARAWKTLNDQIVLLSKRRGQLKQVGYSFCVDWVACELSTGEFDV